MSKRKKPRPPAPGLQQVTATPPAVTDAAGKVWRLGFNTQNAKGALEELFRSHVVREALATKRALGGQDGEDYWDAAQDRLDRGHYRTFAPGWVAILKSRDGVVMFVQSLLTKHHPDVTTGEVEALLSEEPEQVTAAVGVIAPDFFAALAAQMGAKPEDARTAAAEIAGSVGELLGEHATRPATAERATG